MEVITIWIIKNDIKKPRDDGHEVLYLYSELSHLVNSLRKTRYLS